MTTLLFINPTAVVPTPAVRAAASAAEVRDPASYTLICVFISNATSFVLP